MDRSYASWAGALSRLQAGAPSVRVRIAEFILTFIACGQESRQRGGYRPPPILSITCMPATEKTEALFSDTGTGRHPHDQSPFRILIILMISLLVAEMMAMLFLHLLPSLRTWAETFLDCFLMLLLAFPALYYFVLRPLRQQIEERRRLEASLRRHQDRLEQSVQERTAELTTINQQLQREIADHQRAEAAARDSENRYRAMFDNAADAIFITDFAGRIIEANRLACERLGYAREELLARSVQDIDAPECADQGHIRLEEVSKHGSIMFETVHRRQDGGLLPVELSCRTIEYFGQPAVLGIARDLTERKRAEEKLRASESRATALLNASTESIWLIDRDGIILAANEIAARRIGVSVPEVLGKSCFSLLPPDLAQSRQSQVEKVLRSGQAIRFEDERAGIIFDHNFHPIRDHRGHITGVAIFSQDITERKRTEEALRRSEERYRQFFEDDLTGDFVAAPDGRILICNPAFARIHGFASPVESIDTNLASLHLHPDGWDHLLQLVREHRVVERHECAHRRRDGTARHLVENVVGSFNEQGELIEIKGYAFDDSDRKRAELALQKANEELEQRVAERTAELEEKSRFLEAFFRHTLDSFAFLDKHFNFIRVNESYAKGSGAARRTLPGATISRCILTPRTKPSSKTWSGPKRRIRSAPSRSFFPIIQNGA